MDKSEKENCLKIRDYIELSKTKNSLIQYRYFEAKDDNSNNFSSKAKLGSITNKCSNKSSSLEDLSLNESPIFNNKRIRNLIDITSRHNSCKALKFSNTGEENSYFIENNIYSSNPLPNISWGSYQYVWKIMKEKDEACKLDSNILTNHPDLNHSMLQILFEWLSEVSGVLKLKRISYHLTLHLVYTYLYKELGVCRNTLQLIGITCLFIATKIEEIYPPKLKMLAYFTDQACTRADIILQELYCLQVFNWNTSVLTVIDWLGLYMQIISYHIKNEDVKINMANCPNKLNFKATHNQNNFENSGICSLNAFLHLAQMLDLCMADTDSLNFKYSELAASAISFCIPAHQLQCITGYGHGELKLCIKWMFAYVNVLWLENSSNPIKNDYNNSKVKSTCYIVPQQYNANMRPIALFEQPHIHIHTLKLETLHQAIQLNHKLKEYEKENIFKDDCPAPIRLDDKEKRFPNANNLESSLLTPPLSSKKMKTRN